jgi:hypothetical protein
MDQPEPGFETIVEGDDYSLAGGPEGASFVLRHKAEHRTARLAGEDAARFRADYEAVRSQFPDWRADQTLAQLWDQGGYSWLAAEEEG